MIDHVWYTLIVIYKIAAAVISFNLYYLVLCLGIHDRSGRAHCREANGFLSTNRTCKCRQHSVKLRILAISLTAVTRQSVYWLLAFTNKSIIFYRNIFEKPVYCSISTSKFSRTDCKKTWRGKINISFVQLMCIVGPDVESVSCWRWFGQKREWSIVTFLYQCYSNAFELRCLGLFVQLLSSLLSSNVIWSKIFI